MRFSIEPRERRYVKGLKGYGFLSFAKNIGTHAAKVAKNMRVINIVKNLLTPLKICNRCYKDCFKKSNW